MYEKPKVISAEHYSSKLKIRKQRRLLKALSETGNLTKSLEMALVKRSSFNSWQKTDAAFMEHYEVAKEMAADKLEEEAWRRAVDGYDDQVVYQGKAIYHEYPKGHPKAGELMLDWLGDPIPITIRKYSDRMLELLLKGVRPEKFRENVEPQSNFKGGVLIIPMMGQPTEEGRAEGALTWEQQCELRHAKYKDQLAPKTIEHQPAVPKKTEDKEPVPRKPVKGGPVVNG